MIQVFCDKIGSGKTKRLIELANSKVINSKGDSIYIDNNSKYIRTINRKIRFISTNDFEISDCESLYGLICGLISENYDIENIYIDSILNIVSCGIKETSYLFTKLCEVANKYNINLYINIDLDKADMPEFIKKYVA